jgi:hypothetical protein
MVAAKLLKINLKNLIANFPALRFVQAIDGAVDGQRRPCPFIVIDRGFGVFIGWPISFEKFVGFLGGREFADFLYRAPTGAQDGLESCDRLLTRFDVRSRLGVLRASLARRCRRIEIGSGAT